eukprot:TRINITY_DN190_c0_g1_i1.p1 TRINITY_DN190_c0_g1~~TRINITY_DN190_c0_g1_i1.p1  ORF type:complete len:245 (-),score=117.31 TRINITY_DN190_c0_g1_i1:97-831(-)
MSSLLLTLGTFIFTSYLVVKQPYRIAPIYQFSPQESQEATEIQEILLLVNNKIKDLYTNWREFRGSIEKQLESTPKIIEIEENEDENENQNENENENKNKLRFRKLILLEPLIKKTTNNFCEQLMRLQLFLDAVNGDDEIKQLRAILTKRIQNFLKEIDIVSNNWFEQKSTNTTKAINTTNSINLISNTTDNKTNNETYNTTNDTTNDTTDNKTNNNENSGLVNSAQGSSNNTQTITIIPAEVD